MGLLHHTLLYLIVIIIFNSLKDFSILKPNACLVQLIYCKIVNDQCGIFTLEAGPGIRRSTPAFLHEGYKARACLGSTAGHSTQVWTNSFHHLHHDVQNIVLPYRTQHHKHKQGFKSLL